MAQLSRNILYVGAAGTQDLGGERTFTDNGFGVASVTAPESAVTYVKNSNVQVVLLDELSNIDISKFAGSLKVASPFLKIIALVTSSHAPEHVDAVLRKPIDPTRLIAAVHQNLGYAAND